MAYNIEDMKHPVNCLYCGKPIPIGRPDRKFCSANCKNRWHNTRKLPARVQAAQRIIHILEHNHAILDKLIRLGIHSLDRITLMHLGYNQDYVTSYRKSGIHHQFAVFDIRYEQTPTRIKKIVRTSLSDDADHQLREEGD